MSPYYDATEDSALAGQKDLPPIPTHFSITLSVCLSVVCLSSVV